MCGFVIDVHCPIECLLKSGCQRFNFNTYHLILCMYQKIWNKIFRFNSSNKLVSKFNYRSKSILHDPNQCKRLIYRDKMCVCICFKLVVSIAVLKFEASSSRYRNLNLISYQLTFFNQSKQCFIHLNISPAAAMTD